MRLLEVVPLVSVGEIRFGESDQELVRKGFKEDPTLYDKNIGWRGFKKDDDFICYVEENRVVAISSSLGCSLNGIELIGLAMSEFKELKLDSRIDDAIWVNEEIQEVPVVLNGLGIQLWFRNGVVESIFCDDS